MTSCSNALSPATNGIVGAETGSRFHTSTHEQWLHAVTVPKNNPFAIDGVAMNIATCPHVSVTW